MDKLIANVMRLVRNMQFERIIRHEKGYVPRKLCELRQKHRLAANCDFQWSTDADDSNKYTLISSSSSDVNMYTIEFIQSDQPCCCLLKCDECDICIHSIRCDCFDATIKGNLCKHAHFIAMNRPKVPIIQSPDQDEAELIIGESQAQLTAAEERSIFLSQNVQQPIS